MRTEFDFHGRSCIEALSLLNSIFLEAFEHRYTGDITLVTGMGPIRESLEHNLKALDIEYKEHISNIGRLIISVDYEGVSD